MTIEAVEVRCDTCHDVTEVTFEGLQLLDLVNTLFKIVIETVTEKGWIVNQKRDWHFCSKECADVHKTEFPEEYKEK